MRTLAIGLDGFEISIADALMARGEMPNLAALRDQSARFELDHGADRFSGLAWERVSSGVSPSDGARWSAVSFDPRSYRAVQERTSARPFVADLPLRAVVFDAPYWDLGAARQVRGLTGWGAHDPGVAPASRPARLQAEVAERFGPYPATRWIYGFSWPSVRKTRESAAALASAVAQRGIVAEWLLAERLPDWDLALVVVSECHSAIEPFWHGVDPTHPLHRLPSAAPAKNGLHGVYREVDALIGRLRRRFGDVSLALFAMHGMGTNEADLASMVLLPELLHRHAFGRAHLREKAWPGHLDDGTPLVGEDAEWGKEIAALVPMAEPAPPLLRRLLARATNGGASPGDRGRRPGDLLWMPAQRYRGFWPEMPAFALPSFYDGRVRVNLEGREAHGIVPRSRYRQVQGEIADLLSACTEPLGGRDVVERIDLFGGPPEALSDSQADLTVVWRNEPIGLRHPRLGRIGPLPWRRTGGHTGGAGFLHLAGAGLAAGDHGRASAFDVVPTLLTLTDSPVPAFVSGRSLIAPLASRSVGRA